MGGLFLRYVYFFISGCLKTIFILCIELVYRSAMVLSLARYGLFFTHLGRMPFAMQNCLSFT